MHLASYMALRNLSDGDVALAIGRSRVSVNRYRRKLVRPDWDVIDEIRRFSQGAVTEADWRLFPTLIRFDAVYYSHFKCNWRHIYQYPNLSNYVRDLYQVPGVAETVSLEQIKRHYYFSQRQVNPTGIVPVGPQLDFAAPHDRARFG